MNTLNPKKTELIFESVSKTFGQRTVINDLSLRIPFGESLVVLGPSGVGKSVLLKCALGLMESDSGRIYIRDEKTSLALPILKRGRKHNEIGVVFQSSALFDSLNVLENVSFRALQLYSPDKALNMARTALEKVDLSHSEKLYPNELSGGMKRRVALARAIALHPRFLFFDEPTTGLDPVSACRISLLIRQCITDLGATALTITHDIQSALTIGDRACLLYAGNIVWSGPIAELSVTDDPMVRQFVSGSCQGPIHL